MDYLAVLRKRVWIIVVAAAVFAAAAAGISLATDPQYQASTRLLYQKNNLDTLILGVAVFSNTTADREVRTGALLTDVVADSVVNDLNLTISRETLLGKIEVESFTDTDVIEITVESGDATEAARIADTFAQNLIAYRAGLEQEKVDSVRQLLQVQLDALAGNGAESDYAAQLRAQLSGLQMLESAPVSGFKVLNSATIPSAPFSPTTGLNIVRAAILGIIVGIILVLLVQYLPALVRWRTAKRQEPRMESPDASQ